MYYAVISDVHANREALDAVLRDIEKREITDIYFLGDAVGYGPEPNECISLLKEACHDLLAGNHDWGACGLTDISFFNPHARAAIEWTREALIPDHTEFLRSLPAIAVYRNQDITCAHATPYEPEQWHYLLSHADAELNFRHCDTRLCFIGHSHQPFIMEQLPSGELLTYHEKAPLHPERRYIINAGSVGQPRDRDPRSSYTVIDGKKVEIVRVSYDIESTQKKMSTAGLPYSLIERLSHGM